MLGVRGVGKPCGLRWGWGGGVRVTSSFVGKGNYRTIAQRLQKLVHFINMFKHIS